MRALRQYFSCGFGAVTPAPGRYRDAISGLVPVATNDVVFTNSRSWRLLRFAYDVRQFLCYALRTGKPVDAAGGCRRR